MNERSLGALIALNVVLLIALAVVGFSPTPAAAQLGAGGEYVMVAGATRGRTNQAAIYIIDLRSARTAAVFYNDASGKFEPVARREMSDDMVGGRR